MAPAEPKQKKWLNRLKGKLKSGPSSHARSPTDRLTAQPMPTLQRPAASTVAETSAGSRAPAAASQVRTDAPPAATQALQQAPSGDPPPYEPLSPDQLEAILRGLDFLDTYKDSRKTCDGALLCAATHGNEQVVQALLDAGVPVLSQQARWAARVAVASPDTPYYTLGRRTSGVLHVAILHENMGTVCRLLDHWWLTECVPLGGGGEATQEAERMGELLNLRDSDKRTPLNVAAEAGSVEIATELLDRGAHVDIPDYVGRTPLHQAARCGRLEVVRLLLARGADLSRRDKLNRTAIERARANRHWDVVNLLTAAERERHELPSAEEHAGAGHEIPSEKQQPARDMVASKEVTADRKALPSAAEVAPLAPAVTLTQSSTLQPPDVKTSSVQGGKAANIEAGQAAAAVAEAGTASTSTRTASTMAGTPLAREQSHRAEQSRLANPSRYLPPPATTTTLPSLTNLTGFHPPPQHSSPDLPGLVPFITRRNGAFVVEQGIPLPMRPPAAGLPPPETSLPTVGRIERSEPPPPEPEFPLRGIRLPDRPRDPNQHFTGYGYQGYTEPEVYRWD